MKTVFYTSIAITASLLGLAFCHATKLIEIPSWVYLMYSMYFVCIYFFSMAQSDQLDKQNKEIINRLITLDTRMHHLHKKDEVIQMFTKAMTRSYGKAKSNEGQKDGEKVLGMKELIKDLNVR